MSGFCIKGKTTIKSGISKIIRATKKINNKNDEVGFLYCNGYLIGYKDVIISKRNDNILIFDGIVFNKDELILKLRDFNYCITDDSIGNIILALIECSGIEVINEINGAFTFAYITKDSIYFGRDHVGLKELYYSISKDELIIGTSIKCILAILGEAVVDKNGVSELLAMGPSRSINKTLYKNIFQVKPGNYAIFNGLLEEVEYFKLLANKTNESFNDSKCRLKKMLDFAIIKRIPKTKKATTLLSGGLDSTIVTSVVSKNISNLETYSIDYQDNNCDYQANLYETSNDQDYIKYALDMFKISNNHVLVSNKDLIKLLKDVVVYRDGPGMTTIDASLYQLCKLMERDYDVALTGECSDELLGGYRWNYSGETFENFPWIRNVELRQKLINKNLGVDIEAYTKNEYNRALKEIDLLKEDDGNNDKRIIYYLNIKYFMPALLSRAFKIAEAANVDLRAPFADKDIVNYLYNVDFNYKYHNGEKYILREAYKDDIPQEIYARKKSPYPKSQSKKLAEIIERKYYQAIKDKKSILHKLIDVDEVNTLIASDYNDVPWYGQLLRKTELLAYFYQIHIWGKKYKIKLEL